MRRIVRYMYVAVVLAFLYLGWTFATRWVSGWQLKRAHAAREAARYRGYESFPGTSEVKILQFYASPGMLRRGEKALLCYGVVNAKSVRIEPGIEPITPSRNRCLEIAPAQNSTYTLTAEGAGGRQASSSVVIRVQAP